MAHGFGVTVDSMKAEELRRAAAEEGYDSQYHDDVVTIADLTGLTTGVRKAFNALKNNINKQYN